MQITSLRLYRPASYEPRAGELLGLVELTVNSNKMLIALSDKAIRNIFEVVKEEVEKEAASSAAQVKNIFREAVNGDLLLASEAVEDPTLF